jgi:FixJ family two-component response regulator
VSRGGRLEPPELGVPKRTWIAIVDDDDSVREAIKGLIRSAGFAASTFPSAKEFLASSAISSTSCLIADITMPDMTGPELHAQIKAMGKNIPTILITAYPSDRGREQALKAGVLGYLTKPFSDDDLLDCIRSAVGSP